VNHVSFLLLWLHWVCLRSGQPDEQHTRSVTRTSGGRKPRENPKSIRALVKLYVLVKT
jgi:hypothetical protein